MHFYHTFLYLWCLYFLLKLTWPDNSIGTILYWIKRKVMCDHCIYKKIGQLNYWHCSCRLKKSAKLKCVLKLNLMLNVALQSNLCSCCLLGAGEIPECLYWDSIAIKTAPEKLSLRCLHTFMFSFFKLTIKRALSFLKS